MRFHLQRALPFNGADDNKSIIVIFTVIIHGVNKALEGSYLGIKLTALKFLCR